MPCPERVNNSRRLEACMRWRIARVLRVVMNRRQTRAVRYHIYVPAEYTPSGDNMVPSTRDQPKADT